MKTIIHVNRHNIAKNRKGNPNYGLALFQPVFTVKDYKRNRRGYSVSVDGPSTFVYRPEKPLKCGAVAWVETQSKVYVDGDEG